MLLKNLFNQLDFLFFYTKAKLEAESFRHFAGYLWWILDPLFSVGVYFFLFKVLLNRGGEDYIQFLFIGLVSWKWFADSINKSSGAILSNLSLAKKIRMKKNIFPIVEILYNSWKFIVIFAFILVLYALMGYSVTGLHFFIIPLLLSQLVLIFGGGLFLSSIMPFFPDLKFIITYLLRLMFYPSGVLFALSQVPEKYIDLIYLNPMTGLIEGYRRIVMYGESPNTFSMIYASSIGIVLIITGTLIIKKYEQEYPKLS